LSGRFTLGYACRVHVAAMRQAHPAPFGLKFGRKLLIRRGRFQVRFEVFPRGIKLTERTLTPPVLVRIQVPQPNLSFRGFARLTRRIARRAHGRFCQQIKGLAQGSDHLAVLPGAV
jgi:hypothetical protein